MSRPPDIALSESQRLNQLGIPFNFIHVSENKPIVIVDDSVLKSIVMSRRSGNPIPGLFISNVADKDWSATIINSEGKCEYKTHLTESKAYRMALGYMIGRKSVHTRYVGQQPKRKPKTRHRPKP